MEGTVPPHRKSRHTGRNIGLAIVVLIVIGAIIIYSTGGFGGSNYSVTDNINSLNLQVTYNGATSGYFGPTSQTVTYSQTVSGNQQFTVSFTITSSALLLSHSINSIQITTSGFTLISDSPNLPYSMSPGGSATFTITVQAPNTAYTGPLTISIDTT